MNGLKKTLNVFGIIFAWVLSIVMVLMLLVSPLVQSMLSLLEPEIITKAVTSIFNQSGPSSAAPAQKDAEYGLVTLSNGAAQTPPADDIAGVLNSGMLEDILGTDVDEEVVNKILSSKAAQEFIETYTEDITNAMTGGSGEMKFNAEKIIEIVDKNMDEIVEIIQEVSPEITADDVEKLKDDIRTAVNENADHIVQALPKPEQIVDEVKNANPELELAFEILAQKNNIKMAITGIIVVLSVLIFLCRLPGLRGFRWLATDLFVGFGLNGLICVGLLLGSTMAEGLMADNAQMVGIMDAILSALTVNMLIRTAVLLVSAVALLVVYILIKKARAKKLAANVTPTAEPVAETVEVTAEAEEEAVAQLEAAPAAEADV